jgi:1,4-alpha-glucan branching enzyme
MLIKKITILFLLLFISIMSQSQVLTSVPAFVTQNGGNIDVIYDATLGNAALKDYSGTDVYAHTGVITSLSSSNSDWKHAPVWLDNSSKYKMTSLGNNKWKLSITPDMTTYYGLTTGEVVQKMAFVFRNSTGTLQGKDVGNADIFMNVYQSGFNVAFSNPSSNQSLSAGTVMNIQVNASLSSTINLQINGSTVQTASAATSLSYSYTFSNVNDYTLIASATVGGTTVYDTTYVCVPAPVTNQARPTGVIDGINYIDNTTATLVLYAPGKSTVFLLGDFNNWVQLNAYQLKKDGNYWWITLTGLNPGQIYGFQYLVDGTIKSSDPYTEMILDPWNDQWINQYYSIYPNLKPYPAGKTTGLVATLRTAKPSYNWQIPNFIMPSRENMVIYELLLRDFTKEKSLDAAITKLDYLKNLGVTAIELMPITEFDGNNSWGYNPNHYFAPDKAYGTADTYKKFIDECHKRGMAVILDMVFNQASGLSPFALLYWDAVNNRPAADNPWMNPVAPHPYSVLNDFNHSFLGTKSYFSRVLQYWITEFKVDGYRMDLAKGFTQNATSGEPAVSNYDQSRVNNLTDYYNAAKSVKSDVMFILEFLGYSSNSDGNAEENQYASNGMYLWRNINNSYSQSAMGFQTGSDFSSMITTPRQWVGYAESHDEERNFYNAKYFGVGAIPTDSVYRIKRVPLNVAFTTLLPGPKMMYEFEEMGFDYSINSFGGRTNPKPSAWDWLSITNRKAAYDACSKIISLRKQYSTAFTQGNYTLNLGISDWNTGRKISLTHSDLNMIVVGNFNATASITVTPNFTKTGTWYELLSGQTLNVTDINMTLTMQAGDILIYTDKVINVSNGISDIPQQLSTKVYPTETVDNVHVNSNGNVMSIRVFNIQGSLIKTTQNKNEISLKELSNGLYLLDVITSEGRSIHKIVKD